MTYNEKKSLYESIMQEAAKTVKRMINEAGVAQLASNHKEYVESAKRVLNLNQINEKDAKYVMQIILYLRHLAENNKTDALQKISSSIDKHYFEGQNWYKTIENGGFDDEIRNLK